MKKLVLILLLPVSGCGPTQVWYKSGATQVSFDRDAVAFRCPEVFQR